MGRELEAAGLMWKLEKREGQQTQRCFGVALGEAVQRREAWRWRWQDEGRESFPPVGSDIFEVFKENSFSGSFKGGCVSQ